MNLKKFSVFPLIFLLFACNKDNEPISRLTPVKQSFTGVYESDSMLVSTYSFSSCSVWSNSTADPLSSNLKHKIEVKENGELIYIFTGKNIKRHYLYTGEKIVNNQFKPITVSYNSYVENYVSSGLAQIRLNAGDVGVGRIVPQFWYKKL